MAEEQKPDSAPYESLLKATVDKIQIQPFLFIIAIVTLIVALVVLGVGLGSADFRFTLVTIAVLALIAILVYYILEARKTTTPTQRPTTTPASPTPVPSTQKVAATDGGQVSDASQQNEGVTQQEITAAGPGSSVSHVQQISGSGTVPFRTGRSSSINSAVHGQLRQVLLDCVPLGERELQNLFIDQRLSPWRNQIPAADTAQARVESLIAFLHNKNNVLGENALVLFLQVAADRLDETDACHQRLLDMAQQLSRSGTGG